MVKRIASGQGPGGYSGDWAEDENSRRHVSIRSYSSHIVAHLPHIHERHRGQTVAAEEVGGGGDDGGGWMGGCGGSGEGMGSNLIHHQ
jgi:hypothetical protein